MTWRDARATSTAPWRPRRNKLPRWSAIRRWGLVTGSLLVLLGVAAVGIYAGLYNIAADVPHTRPVYWLFETVRDRSVAARARDFVGPNDLRVATLIQYV